VVAPQHGHVQKLAKAIGPAVLGHQQAGLHYFEHEAHRRHLRGRAPHVEAFVVEAYPQVNAGVLNGRRQLDEYLRRKAQPVPKQQRLPASWGVSNASEMRGGRPSSRRRLAQKATSMMASSSAAGGVGGRESQCCVAAARCRAKWTSRVGATMRAPR